MWHNRVAEWRRELVDDWHPERAGVDLLYLESAVGRYGTPLTIRADGTWDWPVAGPIREPQPPGPIRPTWELSDNRVLSLWTPVAPMPAYGIEDWTREEKQYLVLAVTGLSLALADSHGTIVFRRVNHEAHARRQASEYLRLLVSFQGLNERDRG
jgi:hypothetical protein